MPAGRSAHATCAFGGKIYVFGGISADVYSSATNTVYVYDPQNDTWAQKAEMPYANAFCAIAVVDGLIYLMGGSQSISSPPAATVMAYDPVTESWVQGADMPTPRLLAAASVVDAKIYVIGGSTENWTSFCHPHVEVYDPATSTWTRRADMPTARTSLGSCVVDGKIYAIGGYLPTRACTINELYDPATDSWTARSALQQKRLGHFVGAIGDKIYAIGGSYPNPQPTHISIVEEYDTGLGVPSPDFNSDGIIDIEDLLRLIESWGRNDPAVDLAPAPFGDGVVNRADLEALMDLWGQEVPDPTLLAHWKLDEAEGADVLDGAGAHDGAVIGVPTWRPDAGKVGGALELDGATCILTDSVVNPNSGPFSILAWIKGGAPGQVIISQAAGADWLLADPASGALMTDLKNLNTRRPTALQSQAIITDGDWHRVGLVWDGVKRSLYVDGVEVAADTQGDLPDSDGGLYLGCGQDAGPETFFTGLIDDVRIYSRAVRP